MTALPTNFIQLLIIWIIILAFLITKFRKFPVYQYEDLKRHHQLEQPPARSSYYWIPHPMVWFSIAVALAAIEYLIYLKQDPSKFLDLLDSISSVIAWMYDSSNALAVIIPLNAVWASLALSLAIYLAQPVSNLIFNEIIQHYFPKYAVDHFAAQLGKFKERFNKSLLKTKEPRIVVALQTCCLLLMITTYLSLDSTNNTILCASLSCVLVIIAAILYLGTPERRQRSVEIRKQFDPVKLGIMWRRNFWRSAIKGWAIIPPIIVATAINIETFTFQDNGIHKLYRLQQAVVPWPEIKPLVVGFEDAKINASDKKQEIHKPHLYVRLGIGQMDVDLNEYGVFELNPRTFTDALAQLNKQNIKVLCQLDDKSRALKTQYLQAKEEISHLPISYQELVDTIEKLCK